MASWMDNDSGNTFHHPLTNAAYRESSSSNLYPRPPPPVSMDEWDRQRESRAQFLLNKTLGPDQIASRQGGGGARLNYIEGWRAINLANDVFGYNGWYTEIKYLEADFIDYHEESQRYNMGVTAIVRVRLQDGASHEDVGYGKVENTKSKADGLDKCKKEAVTDALKRALRHFGKLLGNCLYDKDHLNQITKMKAPKPKFDWDGLYKPEQHNLPLDAPNPPWSAEAVAAAAAAKCSGAPPKPVPPPAAGGAGGAAEAQPHPPHMTAHLNRAKTTTAANPSGSMRPPVKPQQTKPPPHRAATVSHSSESASASSSSVAPTIARPPPAGAPNPLDRSGAQTEFGLSGEDETFFASMDLDSAAATTAHPSAGDLNEGEASTIGTGMMLFEGDSGFAEAEDLAALKDTPRRLPPAGGNPPNQHPPQPQPPAHRPSPEEARAAAQARLAENQRRKEQQAQLRAKATLPSSVTAPSASDSTSAAQLLRATTINGGVAAPAVPALGTARPNGLRAAQPPSRTHSHNNSSSSTAGAAPQPQPHAKVAGGGLPTLKVGAQIASRASTVNGSGVGGGGRVVSGGSVIPAAGGAAGVSEMVSASPERSRSIELIGSAGEGAAVAAAGFVSAKGVKRGVGDGYDPSIPVQQGQQQLQRRPSNTHNNTTHYPFQPGLGARRPLDELEIEPGTGAVKRSRC